MSSMTSYFLQTMLVLGVVCAFAFVALVSAKRIGIGRAYGPIELVGSLPLDARRAVYLLRVGEKVFLVGAAEGGFTKLGEIDDFALPPLKAAEPHSFASVLARLRGTSTPEASPSTTPLVDKSEGPPP